MIHLHRVQNRVTNHSFQLAADPRLVNRAHPIIVTALRQTKEQHHAKVHY